MTRRLVAVLWLTLLWLLLWRDVSVANVLSGLAVALVASKGVAVSTAAPAHGVRVIALVRFALYFVWKLLEANVVLAREVVTPQNVIHTGIIAVPLDACSDLVATTTANAISLTPGTLTLEVRRGPDPVLYIHVLHLHDLDQARAEVRRMAHYVAAAFPPAVSRSTPSEASDR